MVVIQRARARWLSWTVRARSGSQSGSSPKRIFTASRNMVRDFSQLLDTITASVEDDNHIDLEEADEIRQKWEDLKTLVEHFVIGCEKGHYHIKKVK